MYAQRHTTSGRGKLNVTSPSSTYHNIKSGNHSRRKDPGQQGIIYNGSGQRITGQGERSVGVNSQDRKIETIMVSTKQQPPKHDYHAKLELQSLKRDNAYYQHQMDLLKSKLQATKQWKFIEIYEFICKKKKQQTKNDNWPKITFFFELFPNQTTKEQKDLLSQYLKLSNEFEEFMHKQKWTLKNKHPQYAENINQIRTHDQLPKHRQEYDKLSYYLQEEKIKSKKLQQNIGSQKIIIKKIEEKIVDQKTELNQNYRVIEQYKNLIRKQEAQLFKFNRYCQDFKYRDQNFIQIQKELQLQNRINEELQISIKCHKQELLDIYSRIDNVNENELLTMKFKHPYDRFQKIYILTHTKLDGVIKEKLQKLALQTQKHLMQKSSVLQRIKQQKYNLIQRVQQMATQLDSQKEKSVKEKENFKKLEQKIKDAQYFFSTKMKSVKNQYEEKIEKLTGKNNQLAEAHNIIQDQIFQNQSKEEQKRKQIQGRIQQVIRKQYHSDLEKRASANKQLQENYVAQTKRLQQSLKASQSSLQELKNQMYTKQKKHNQIQDTNRAIQNSLQVHYTQRNDALNKMIGQMRSQMVQIDSQHQIAIEKAAQNYNEAPALITQQTNQHRHQLQKITQKLTEVRNQKEKDQNEYQLQITKLSKRITELQQLTDLNSKHYTLANFQSKHRQQPTPSHDRENIDLLKVRIKQFEDLQKTFQDKFTKLREKQQSLLAKSQALEAQNISLRQNVEDLTNKINQMQQAKRNSVTDFSSQIKTQNQTLKQTIQGLKKQKQIYIQKFASETQHLNSKITQLNYSINQKGKKLSAIEAKIKLQDQTIKDHTKTIAQKNQEIQQKDRLLQRMKGFSESKSSQVSALKRELQEVCQSNKFLQKQNQRFQVQLKNFTQKLATQQNIQSQINEITQRLETQIQKSKTLSDQKTALKHKIDALNDKLTQQQSSPQEQHILEIERELQASKSLSNNLYDKLKNAEEQILQLKTQFNQLQSKAMSSKFETTQKLNSLNDTISKLQHQNSELNKKAQQLQTSLNAQGIRRNTEPAQKRLQSLNDNDSILQSASKFFNFSAQILMKKPKQILFLNSVVQQNTKSAIESTKLVYKKSLESKNLTTKISQILNDTTPLRAFMLLCKVKQSNQCAIFCCKNHENPAKALLINLKTMQVFGPKEGTSAIAYSQKNGGSTVEFGAGSVKIQNSDSTLLQMNFEMTGARYFSIEDERDFTNERTRDGNQRVEEIELYQIIFNQTEAERFKM